MSLDLHPTDTPLTVAPPPEPSLAHASVDPPTLVARARVALDWSGSDFLVGLQGYDELMATLDVATDVDGLVRIGDPTSPPVRLLRALNGAGGSGGGIRLTRVARLGSPWRWTRLGGGTGDAEAVALRQQTYSDVVGALGRAGVAFRVLPNETSTEEILAVGRDLGSAVVDVDELRADDILIVGYLEQVDPLDYGLLSRRSDTGPPAGGGEAVSWLSMAAQREAAGTLVAALERFSALGLDLDFLHSDVQGPGRHDFHLGFRSDPAAVAVLQADLVDAGFRSRVLATFALPAAPDRP